MTAFYKVSGGGNDFLALAEPSTIPSTDEIRAWCRRGVSLGADGLFILRRTGTGAAMEYWNADGLAAELCLNGTRCAAQLAFHLGWADGAVEVETAAGRFPARRLDAAGVVLELPIPEAPRELAVEVEGVSYPGWSLTLGVPHFVLLWPQGLDHAPVGELGPAIRRHPAFGAAGTNVNFVRFPPLPRRSPRQGRMEIRTYERGVEDETLACGTGVLAGAAVGISLGRAELPLRALTRSGFEITVEDLPQTGRWSLAGDARIIARGDLLPGATQGPARPAWE